MKACGVILIINEGCLGMFHCQNIWKRRPDGFYQLKLTTEGVGPFLNKYEITQQPVEGRAFNQLVCQNVAIGIAQAITSWE